MPATLLAAALWCGLLIILMVALSVRVTLGRRSYRVSTGDGPDGQLTATSRAFGNAAEYIPAGMAGLVLAALTGASGLEIHVAGALLAAGRLMHPFGMMRPPPNVARALGMVLTWASLLMLAVLLVRAGLTAL